LHTPLYRRAACWLLILCAVLPLRTLAATPERGRVILLVDSTSYMGTLFGGSSKMVAVNNALASVWPNHAASLDMGLTVYGHRISGKAACTDFDVRRRVGALEPEGAGDLLAGLKTKGDAAVSKALGIVGASKDAGAGGSIILVAGGPDSCEADPC
jgi:Ca-activated chloride channel homolog